MVIFPTYWQVVNSFFLINMSRSLFLCNILVNLLLKLNLGVLWPISLFLVGRSGSIESNYIESLLEMDSYLGLMELLFLFVIDLSVVYGILVKAVPLPVSRTIVGSLSVSWTVELLSSEMVMLSLESCELSISLCGINDSHL